MPIKLEFIEDGYEGSPLLLFCGGRSDEVSSLAKIFESLAERAGARVALHELPFIEPYTAVVASSQNHSAGLRPLDSGLEWQQSPAQWDNAAGLVAPFAEAEGGFQFLNSAEGAEVIYSTRRAW